MNADQARAVADEAKQPKKEVTDHLVEVAKEAISQAAAQGLDCIASPLDGHFHPKANVDLAYQELEKLSFKIEDRPDFVRNTITRFITW